MISEDNRTISIGANKLNSQMVISKIIGFIDTKIDDFPAYLVSSDLTPQSESNLNSYLAIFLQSNLQLGDNIGIFRFTFLNEPQTGESHYRPDIGVFLGTQFITSKPIFHIECKRLPARDKAHEKEYVFGKLGGIQRFKECKHGDNFTDSAMIGYIQTESYAYWMEQVNSWIQTLSLSSPEIWNNDDKLQLRSQNTTNFLISRNNRINNKGMINLFHYWILIKRIES